VTMALLPLPMLLAIAISSQLGSHRDAKIVVASLVVALGAYARRFVPRVGPRAALYGNALFPGFLFGILTHGLVKNSQLGWVAVVLWLAALINYVLTVAARRVVGRGQFERNALAFGACCRIVVDSTARLVAATKGRRRARARRILWHRLRQLNDAALLIDAQAGQPDSRSRGAGLESHARLFELELLIENVAHTGERISTAGPAPHLRAEAVSWLEDLRDGRRDDAARATATRVRLETGDVPEEGAADTAIWQLAAVIADAGRALDSWPPPRPRPAETKASGQFESAVNLRFGDLPGSMLVGAEAAARGQKRRGGPTRRFEVDAATRLAVQTGLAAACAAWIGLLVSEPRFYWAVFAVFVAFIGTNTAGEQVTKAAHRVAGTVVGIVLGSLLAQAVGHSSWSIAVIIVALAAGVYFGKATHAVFIAGVTVAASQLYEQLGQYSHQLLLVRLEETAIGASIAMLAALFLFPVSTRRAARIAGRGCLERLGDLLERVGSHLQQPHPQPALTDAARALDSAIHQLVATARPLRHAPWRGGQQERNIGLISITGHHARNMIAEIERRGTLEPRVARCLSGAVMAEREAFDSGGAPSVMPRHDGARANPARWLVAPRAPGAPDRETDARLMRDIGRLHAIIGELHPG
jgi:hypothetical protein